MTGVQTCALPILAAAGLAADMAGATIINATVLHDTTYGVNVWMTALLCAVFVLLAHHRRQQIKGLAAAIRRQTWCSRCHQYKATRRSSAILTANGRTLSAVADDRPNMPAPRRDCAPQNAKGIPGPNPRAVAGRVRERTIMWWHFAAAPGAIRSEL